MAAAYVDIAHIVEAADHFVESYALESGAEEATAALHLAGIRQVVVNPGAGQSVWRVMVPHDFADEASAVLQRTQICQVKTFGAPSGAVQAMQALKDQGINATIGSMKVTGIEGVTKRLFTVYVNSADVQSAQNIIGGP